MEWISSDLRKNKSIAVGLVIVLSLCQSVLSALCLVIGSARSSVVDGSDRRIGSLLLQLCVPITVITFLIAVIVIFISTETGLRQRRKDLAMLELQGATDGQVLSRAVCESLILLIPSSVISAVVSPVAAPFLWKIYVAYLYREQAGGSASVPFSWDRAFASIATGILIGLIASICGTLLTIREIRRVSALEIIRDDFRDTSSVSRTRTIWGMIFLILTVIVLAAPIAAIGLSRNSQGSTGAGSLFLFEAQVSSIITFIISLSLLGPKAIHGATAAWLSLVPSASAPVWVVKQQASRKSEQRAGITTLLTILLILYFAALGADRTRTASIDPSGRLNSGSGLFSCAVPGIAPCLCRCAGELHDLALTAFQRYDPS